MDAGELVRTVAPTVGTMGARFYFDPATQAKGAELGLDPFQFYFLGRGGVLGDVEAPVVGAAFGYFAPKLLASMWEAGRAKVAPREAARAFVGCCQSFGRAAFAGVARAAEGEMRDFCAAAEKVVEAADRGGLALFAGVAAEPLAEDVAGRAMQLVMVLRELRGGVHLVAVVASGVAPKVAHRIRRPNDMGLFGYAPEEIPEVTPEDRANLAAADALTDRLLGGPFGVLDEDGRQALARGLERMDAALAVGG